MRRLCAVGLRGASMGFQFVAGIAVVMTRDADMASRFFGFTAAVPILVTLAGMELHTATDRLVARGLAPLTALRWLIPREATMAAIVAMIGCVAAEALSIDWSITLLAIANMVFGLACQEVFRLHVAVGEATTANLLMAVRNAVPFGLTLPLWWLVPGFDVNHLFVAWAACSALGAVAGLIWLSARDRASSIALPSRTEAIRAVTTYLPSSFVVRLLLAGDVVVLSTFASGQLMGIYGTLNNLVLAIFTVADVAVVQWRFSDVMRMAEVSAPRLRRELGMLAGVAGALVLTLGIGWGAYLNWAGLSPLAVIALAATLSVVAVCSTLAQGLHIEMYSRQSDSRLRSIYLVVGGAYALALLGGLGAGWVAGVLAARVLAWLALSIALKGSGRRAGVEV